MGLGMPQAIIKALYTFGLVFIIPAYCKRLRGFPDRRYVNKSTTEYFSTIFYFY